MSYQERANEVGRIPFEFVELQLDYCENTFGDGVTCLGTGEPCYKTWATCKSKSTYKKGFKSFYFISQRSDSPVGFDAFALLQSVQYASQQLTPGKGLGVRGAVTIKFSDAVWPDHNLDPYFELRPEYDEENLGTFWGRFLARNKYYQSRFVKIYTGYLDDAGQIVAENFKSRAYIIEKIAGPDRNGDVSITAKDVLKLADNERAKCPIATNARLDAAITDSQTTLKVYPAGIGNKEFNTSGFIRISGELLSFTRNADTFTVVRGALNTAKKAQDVDSTVQQSAIFNEMRVQDIIYELLVNFAGVPAGYINKPSWDAESNKYLKGVFSAKITEPVGVNTLIAELCEQGQCYIWWDEVAQLIRFKALIIPAEGLQTYSDDQFIADSITANIDTEGRFSRFIVYFDLIDPTKKLDEPSNYRQRHIGVDLQSETDEEYGSSKSKLIYSRWFNGGSFGRVQQLTTALLTRYRDPPRLLNFDLDASELLNTGDYFYAFSKAIQNVKGQPDLLPMQVMEMQESKAGSIVKYKATELIAVEQEEQPDGDVIITGDVFDINLRAMYEAEFGPPPESGEITFFVSSTAFVCSTSAYRPAIQNIYREDSSKNFEYINFPATAELPAIDTGIFPSELTVNLIVAGMVIGRGGDGAIAQEGIGAAYSYPESIFNQIKQRRDGYAGAPAVLNRHNKFKVVIDGGVVARGGSGGGASPSGYWNLSGSSVSGASGAGGAPYGGIFSQVTPIESQASYKRYYKTLFVLSSANATVEKAGQGFVHEYTGSAYYRTGRSGNGGAWGGKGQSASNPSDPGRFISYGGQLGLAGPGGPAIIGIAPVSVEYLNGGQLLQTL